MKHFLLIFFMVLGGAVGSLKAQVLLDHDFEDGSLTGWSKSTNTTLNVVSDGANGTNNAIQVGAVSTADVIRPPWASGLNIVNGKYYVSSVYVKDISGTGVINWRVFAQTPSANVSLGTINSTTSYKKYMFLTDKLPEGADHRFTPQFNQTGTYYLDEMILREAVVFENSGFEDDFFALDTAQGSATATFSIETDLANVYEGSKSMKIDVTAAAGHTDASVDFQQKQFVDPLKTYKFSCIIKGVGSVMLRATPYDINGVNLAVSINDYSRYVASISTEFKEQALEFITPANTAYVVLELGFGKATGVRWVDALAFDEITTWTGANSTDWMDAGNWTNGVPNAAIAATIPNGLTNYPEISATSVADVLNLTVQGSATIRIQGHASSTGSLIVHGTADIQNNTGIIVRPWLPGDLDWHVISSPVAGRKIADFAGEPLNHVAKSGSMYAVTGYDEGADNWNTAYTDIGSTDEFVAGKGYSLLDSLAGVIAFRGTLNNSDYPLLLDSTQFGWNAIGNPYTAAISVSDLLAANNGVLSSSFGAFYLWDAAASQYVELNNLTPQQYIAVGQGFFARANADAVTFNINRSMRSHQNGEVLKSGSQWPSIELTAAGINKQSSTRIAFGNGMTNGLDVTYDAGMFKADKNFALYTRLVDDNGIDFGIQALPEAYSELVVPVGIDVPEGTEVTFTAKALGLPAGAGAWLEDRAVGTVTRLDESGAFYSVTITAQKSGTGNFFLHTKYSTTGAAAINEASPYKVIVNRSDRSIRIMTAEEQPGQARLYDILGRLHGVLDLQKGTDNHMTVDARPGVYMIRIVGGNKTFSEKIVWNK